MTGGEPFRILVICTANICRSPMAERMLRHAAGQRGLDVEVTSAGFLFDGEPASSKTIAVMAEREIDLADHRSRIVTAELIEHADLAVTMERSHARELIVEYQSGVHRVHTLGGMADALADIDPPPEMSPAARVATVIGARPAGHLLSNGSDEVSDPHGQSKQRHRLARDRIAVLVGALLDGLFELPSEVAGED